MNLLREFSAQKYGMQMHHLVPHRWLCRLWLYLMSSFSRILKLIAKHSKDCLHHVCSCLFMSVHVIMSAWAPIRSLLTQAHTLASDWSWWPSGWCPSWGSWSSLRSTPSLEHFLLATASNPFPSIPYFQTLASKREEFTKAYRKWYYFTMKCISSTFIIYITLKPELLWWWTLRDHS